ncbi:hypothetical protein NMY22_g4507 [Coprinellus aureogranulatus]|nr:hypothetical protein NMY22_g4507 [Coprinellus aureogranulatus]
MTSATRSSDRLTLPSHRFFRSPFMPSRHTKRKRDAQGRDADVEAKEGHAVVIDHQRPLIEGLFHLERAMGYRTLYTDECKLVDSELLMALGQMFTQFANGVIEEKLDKDSDTAWASVMEVFMQSSFFEKDGEATELRESFMAHDACLSRNASNFWKRPTDILDKYIKKTKASIGRQALQWFQQTLVKDPNIRQSVKLDVRLVIREQAETIELVLNRLKSGEGEQRDPSSVNAGPRQSGTENCEKVFYDIGILRFPDFQRPYVQVYRIQLAAWTEVNVKELEIKSGITGGLWNPFSLTQYPAHILASSLQHLSIPPTLRLLEDI